MFLFIFPFILFTMARNEEKAQSMLNRYLAGKRAESDVHGGKARRRPFLASECDDLADADRWRHQVLREIGRKVMEIQNAGLGASQLMDLNDEINKLLREKTHWERRIVELGGPDFSKTAPGEAPGAGQERGKGYQYFGAAKDLPGVKELFSAGGEGGGEGEARAGARRPPRRRAEAARRLDATYFGFRDEDDGVLLKLERAAEESRKRAALDAWWEQHASDAEVPKPTAEGGSAPGAETDAQDGRMRGALGARVGSADGVDAARAAAPVALAASLEDRPAEEAELASGGYAAHVPLPSEEDIKSSVLQAKKKALLERLAA